MSLERHPSEIKDDDLSLLATKAEKAKSNGNKAHILLFVIYFAVAYLIAPFLLFISGEVVIESYPRPVIITTGIEIAIFILFFTMYATVLLYFYLGLEVAVRRIFKLKYDELTFYECILIAKYLKDNKREKAIKEVDGFLSWLHLFQSTSWYNSKAKRYKPEIKLLNQGRAQVKRLVLFSTDKRLPELFINFGLNLTKGSDASAYSLLKEIIDKTKRYGKIIGWLDKIRGSATTLQIILYSISILIGIIVSVIAVLISLGVI